MTIPDDHIVVSADRFVVFSATIFVVCALIAFGVMTWTLSAAMVRNAELLDRADAAESAADACEYLSITSAFDRAATALELHAQPRRVIGP